MHQTQGPEARELELTKKPHLRASFHGTKSSLFLQKTRAQGLAPTWQFINSCNSSSWESNVFLCPLWALHMCAYRHYIHTYVHTYQNKTLSVR